MPLLYLRNSFLVQEAKLTKDLAKLGISLLELLETNGEALKQKLLGKNTVLQAEGESLQAPLMEAIGQWNTSLLEHYPELDQHATALKVKMEKLAQRTAETRYRAQKRRHKELMSSVDRAMNAIYLGGVFWERRASYIDLVGILGLDPRDAMVEKMSTIKAGTVVIHPNF
jgi:hypothetical protein